MWCMRIAWCQISSVWRKDDVSGTETIKMCVIPARKTTTRQFDFFGILKNANADYEQ